MTLALSCNGKQLSLLALTIPYYGVWVADVSINVPDPLPSTQGGITLGIGNLTLLGTAFRAASFAGSCSSRVVGGYGGWRKPAQPRAYTNGGGNRLSMLLGDLAAEVGEKVVLASDGTVSGAVARFGSTAANPVPASQVLAQLGGPLWWIDPSGVTRVGPRTSRAITSAFTVGSWSGSHGSFEIATEDPASWMPGNTFSSDTVPTVQTISSVRIESDNDGVMRLRVLSTGEAIAA